MTDEEIDAMEAGPQLDALIAEKVMNWHLDSHLGFFHWLDSDNQPQALIADFEPSTDIAAAWPVVEKLNIIVWPLGTGSHKALKGKVKAYAQGAPLAICRAALKAVQQNYHEITTAEVIELRSKAG